MSKVVIEVQKGIGLIRLNNGVTNAISPELVNELEAALQTVENECRGMVLAGGGKFFSMGLDLPTLIPLGKEAFSEFFDRFNRVLLRLFTLPMPTCCAIAGHAPAGGTVLALGCDYRFAVPEKKLGVNEIRLGVPVPYLSDMILRQIAGDRAATEMIYGGDFVAASDAVRSGLVDAVFSAETLEAEALKKVAGLAPHSLSAFRESKENRVEAVRARYEMHGQAKNQAFVDLWFSDMVRPQLEAAARKF